MCGKVSYAAQTPWILPDTVRENILVGEDYDEELYHSVLKACALEKVWRVLSREIILTIFPV